MKMSFISLKYKLFAYSKTKHFWFYLGFFGLILLIFLINGFHEKYPDEFDNILGGWYLLHGKLIYKDWFTHHGPVAYFIAALVNLFSFHSFVKFRIVYSLMLFVLTVGSFVFIRKRLKEIDTKFYLYFILLLALSATYFWGHMLLSDNISAFFLLPVFALIFLKTINNKIIEIKDYIFISLFTFLALMSALTYSFLVAGIFFFLIVYYFLQKRNKFDPIFIAKIIIIFSIPYLFFLLYLLITGSLSIYYYEAIKFNRDFYIYYPGFEGKIPANPVRYAIIIAQGFHNNFSSMLNTIRDFNFNFPFNIALAVSNTSLGIYLLLKKKYLVFAFVLGALIYANARTNPFSSPETDYQSAVYIMFSLFNTAYIIPTLYKELNSNIDYAKRLIFSGVFIVLLIYSFYNVTFILRKFSYKTYDKFMGLAPLIYDRPKIAPYINQIEGKNDTAWIGPFYFEDLFYMNAKVPSRYQIFIPGMGHSPKMSQELLNDFEKNTPDVIYFNKNYHITGPSPEEYGQFFLSFLNQNYVALGDYERNGIKYSNNVDPSLEFDKKFFINKIKADAIINKMIEQNLIAPK